MTVQQMLRNMSQKELCTWMAYFRIEAEEHEAENEGRKSNAPQITVRDKSKEPRQNDKDGILFQQLMALSGQGLATFECVDE